MRAAQKLDAETAAVAFALVQAGNQDEATARVLKISRATYYRWLQRGRTAQETLESGRGIPEEEYAYLDFHIGIEEAKARAEAGCVEIVLGAARGPLRERHVVTKLIDGVMTVVENREFEKPGDWRAAAFWLERATKNSWNIQPSLNRQDEHGGGGTLPLNEQLEITQEEALEMARIVHRASKRQDADAD